MTIFVVPKDIGVIFDELISFTALFYFLTFYRKS